jgi:hypothetical protein
VRKTRLASKATCPHLATRPGVRHPPAAAGAVAAERWSAVPGVVAQAGEAGQQLGQMYTAAPEAVGSDLSPAGEAIGQDRGAWVPGSAAADARPRAEPGADVA